MSFLKSSDTIMLGTNDANNLGLIPEIMNEKKT